MGAAGIIVGIFLIFSLSISWVSGDRHRAKIENALKDEQTAKSSIERDLNNAMSQITRDNEQLADLSERLRAESSEKTRLERELNAIERQKRMAEEQGISSSPEIEKEREKIRTELETKSKEDIAKLESRLFAAEEARKRAEEKWTQAELAASKSRELEERLRKEEDAKRSVQEALKKYEAALARAQSRLSGDGMSLDEGLSSRFKDIHSTIDNAGPAGLISVTVSKELNDSIKELENILAQARKNRLALKGMLAKVSFKDIEALSEDTGAAELSAGKMEREGARFSTEQLQKDIKETAGDEFKQRIAGLEERLVSLKDDKKVINERWGEAMTAIVNMEETSQRIETLLKTSEKSGELKTIGIGSAEDQLKFQTDIDALRKSREDMRQAMEKVKSAIATSLESETKRVLSESSQVSDQLNTLFAEGRLQGQNKNMAAAIAAKESLTASGELKEEPVEIRAEKKIRELSLIASNISAGKESSAVITSGVAAGVASGVATGVAVGTAACTDGSLDVYIVKKGDSLSTIAYKKGIYGDENMWPILYKYNLFTVFGPDTIMPGDKLYVKRDTQPAELKDAHIRSVARGKWIKQTPHMKNWIMDWLKTR